MSYLMQIGWQPHIGDPTFWGWLTVGVYLLAAVGCWFRSRTAVAHPNPLFHRRFWQGQAVLLFLLALNKQLNFLSLFTTMTRTLARQHQWWGDRWILQYSFISIVSLLILSLFVLSIWHFRHISGRYLLASVGILLLIGFVLIRATSLHVVDYYLYTFVAGIRLNSAIELGLLAFLSLITLFPVNFHTRFAPTSVSA